MCTNFLLENLKGRDHLISGRESNIEMGTRIPCLLLYWCMPVNVALIDR